MVLLMSIFWKCILNTGRAFGTLGKPTCYFMPRIEFWASIVRTFSAFH